MKILRGKFRKEIKRKSHLYGENIVGQMMVCVAVVVGVTLMIFGTGMLPTANVLAQSVSSNELDKSTPEINDEILEAETATIKYSGTDGDLNWTIDTDGHLEISGTGDYEGSGDWCSYASYIKTATVNVTGITNATSMFSGCSNMYSVDLQKLDTSLVTDMKSMFSGCGNLEKLDLSSFNTSSVTNMSKMFSMPRINKLKELDIKCFDTSKVTDMSEMFYYCNNLTSLDVSGFDTSSVTDMGNMFYWCSNLVNLDVSGFNTSSVTDMHGMFRQCSNITYLNVTDFDTHAVIYIYGMFNGCKSLVSLDVSKYNTSSVTNMENMFYGCSSLISLDVSGFDTSNVKSMRYMFLGCKSLTSLDVSNFKTNNVKIMERMFGECSDLTSLDISNFDTSAVINMYAMFSGCEGLKNLQINNIDTSLVTDMRWMFSECSNLTSLDISGFDMSAVTDMSDMFLDCNNLSQLKSPKNIKGDIALPTPEDGFGWYDGSGNACTSLASGVNASITYTKRKQMVPGNTIISQIQPLEYTGSAIQPTVTVTCDGVQLQSGTDYTVAYQNNSNVGKAVANITGQGFYVGNLKTTFEITPKNMGNNTQISLGDISYYTGSEIKPPVVVTCDGVDLQQGKDYIVSYANNINPGNATVTVTGQGNYIGSVQTTFQIKCNLAKAKIESLEYEYDFGNLKKLDTKIFYSLYLDFTPVTYATGYEIELTDSNGKRIKSVTGDCNGKEFIEKNFNKLSNNVYGVRIRCSRDGEYGEWSDITYVVKQPKAQARNYKGNIQIKWQKLSGVSGYEIYMGTSKTGKLTKVATAGKNTTMKTIKKIGKKKLKKGTYYYYVLAVKKVNGKTYKSKVGFKYNIKKK